MHFARQSICNKVTVAMLISKAEVLSSERQGGEAARAEVLGVSSGSPGLRLALGSGLWPACLRLRL